MAAPIDVRISIVFELNRMTLIESSLNPSSVVV